MKLFPQQQLHFMQASGGYALARQRSTQLATALAERQQPQHQDPRRRSACAAALSFDRPGLSAAHHLPRAATCCAVRKRDAAGQHGGGVDQPQGLPWAGPGAALQPAAAHQLQARAHGARAGRGEGGRAVRMQVWSQAMPVGKTEWPAMHGGKGPSQRFSCPVCPPMPSPPTTTTTHITGHSWAGTG